MTKLFSTILVTALFAFLSIDVIAQGGGGPPGGGGPGGGGPPCPPSCPTIPIDGGISLLAVLGLGFGAKKLKDAKNDKATLA